MSRPNITSSNIMSASDSFVRISFFHTNGFRPPSKIILLYIFESQQFKVTIFSNKLPENILWCLLRNFLVTIFSELNSNSSIWNLRSWEYFSTWLIMFIFVNIVPELHDLKISCPFYIDHNGIMSLKWWQKMLMFILMIITLLMRLFTLESLRPAGLEN